jgi:hypothetical protein
LSEDKGGLIPLFSTSPPTLTPIPPTLHPSFTLTPTQAEFRAMLTVLSTLSFDVKTMSSLFCLVSFSFYGSLLGTTPDMLAVVLIALAMHMFFPSKRGTVGIAAAYFCISTFPVVSVKTMETFACLVQNH